MMASAIFAVWGCAVTAATLFVGLQMNTPEETMDEQPKVEEILPVISQPKMLVAPIVVDRKATGYLFANVSLEMDAEILAGMKVPLDVVMQDGYLALVVGNPDFSFPKTQSFKLTKFKTGLASKINAAVGGKLVRASYFSGVNFLSVSETRSKQTLRSVWLQEHSDASDE